MIQSTLVGRRDLLKATGTLDECFASYLLKDDRFVMVRSKGSVKNVGTPYRGCMQLRSMSRRPAPYTHVYAQQFVNSHDSSTSRKPNGTNRSRVKNDSSSIIIKDGCAKYSACKYIIYCITGMLVYFLGVSFISFVFPYPMHASCIVKWKFGDSCTYTMQKFRSQILDWSSFVNCGSRGSKCLYTLKEPRPSESNVIRAVHLAPNLKTMESIKIDFAGINKSCVATGESVSNEWFRIFDYGTNYCNLHNLVAGIGFDKNSKFLELTTNAVCTEYNTAICD